MSVVWSLSLLVMSETLNFLCSVRITLTAGSIGDMGENEKMCVSN